MKCNLCNKVGMTWFPNKNKYEINGFKKGIEFCKSINDVNAMNKMISLLDEQLEMVEDIEKNNEVEQLKIITHYTKNINSCCDILLNHEFYASRSSNNNHEKMQIGQFENQEFTISFTDELAEIIELWNLTESKNKKYKGVKMDFYFKHGISQDFHNYNCFIKSVNDKNTDNSTVEDKTFFFNWNKQPIFDKEKQTNFLVNNDIIKRKLVEKSKLFNSSLTDDGCYYDQLKSCVSEKNGFSSKVSEVIIRYLIMQVSNCRYKTCPLKKINKIAIPINIENLDKINLTFGNGVSLQEKKSVKTRLSVYKNIYYFDSEI